MDSGDAQASFTLSGSSRIYEWLTYNSQPDLYVARVDEGMIRLSGPREAIRKTMASLREQGLLEDADIRSDNGFGAEDFASLELSAGEERDGGLIAPEDDLPENEQQGQEEDENPGVDEAGILNSGASTTGTQNASDVTKDPLANAQNNVSDDQDTKDEEDRPQSRTDRESDQANIIQDDGQNNGEIEDVLGSFFSRLENNRLGEDFDPLQDNINDFVIQSTTEQGLSISIDADGAGSAHKPVELTALQGMSTDQLTADDLIVQTTDI